MTAEQFAADLEALIAIARHEGISDEELTALMREATAALPLVPSPISRIVRSRSTEEGASPDAGARGAGRCLASPAEAVGDADLWRATKTEGLLAAWVTAR